jgi:hypothetical protein
MTSQELLEQMIRIEEFGRGISQGAVMMANWINKKIQEEQENKEKQAI